MDERVQYPKTKEKKQKINKNKIYEVEGCFIPVRPQRTNLESLTLFMESNYLQTIVYML